jgi:nucleoside-diphosphate-sugar epimerase
MDAQTKGCEVVNIAYGSSVTLLELLAQLQQLAGTRLAPTWAPPRTGDVRHSLADVTKAVQLFGYRPRVGFAEGIRRTFDWYRSQRQS